MISLDATLINTVVPKSQYFCWHQHVFPSFEESLVLPLWLKTVKCFLGCCLCRPRIKWPPLLNTSSWYLLKVFPARRRTNSENKRQRDEVDGAWGGETCSGRTAFFLFWFYFLGLLSSPLSPPAHYLTPPLYVPSPLTFFLLCSFLFSLTPLFILGSLSIHLV